jgi:serine-type D-Ala-D-Ala carboxypeptidase/endopeptidase (penicillin-binding protein 4)
MNYELKNILIKFIIINPIAIGSSFIIFLSSCSVQRQIAQSANKDVLDAAPLQTAHVGISIYEPATNKYWYDYQGDKYFTPASNTKIATCYAGMKYLGDSLPGLRYHMEATDVFVRPTGDPTFLHPYFKIQKVYELLKTIRGNITIDGLQWGATHLGNGWAWNDFREPYMTERSAWPIYGNVIRIKGLLANPKVEPVYFRSYVKFDSLCCVEDSSYSGEEIVGRRMQTNDFYVRGDPKKEYNIVVPIHTKEPGIVERLLDDTLSARNITTSYSSYYPFIFIDSFETIYSRPTDSLLKPMMHNSDNFFAEQSLLMVSNEKLGIMNDEKIIDTILHTDLKDLPQTPRWVDGSGLSRYNLFTPKDLVFILNKMKNEFGMERVKGIFPTGGQGTLANYYLADSGYVYAKTGTLSGVVALSGYLSTKNGKELIFSVLVNNHQASGTEVRRAVEQFLQSIRKKY